MSTTSHTSSEGHSSVPFPSTTNTSTDSLCGFAFSFDLTGEFPESGVSEAAVRSLRKAARILGEPVVLTAEGQLVPINLSATLPDEGMEFDTEACPKGSWGSVKRLFRRNGREGARKRRKVEKENALGEVVYEYEVVVDAEVCGRDSADGRSEGSCGSRRPLVEAAGRRAAAKGLIRK
ncbi:unnamed protein product [Peniophora sp. CBMAI 1063]|nr:unnamed protein product [Peniophora sp. CBMAI 1063]